MRSHAACGFTLIELMVTLALLAILLGLAVPFITTAIRNSSVRSASEALQNGLRMAQAEYDSARETHDVKKRLRALDAAGDMEVTLAESAAERGKAQIALARVQVSQCTVPAPFTGRVVRIHVKLHQVVNVGAPLVELVSDGPLKLRLNVPSRLLRTLA